MLKRSATVLSALLLAYLPAWVFPASAQTNSFFAPLRAEQLIGMNVEASDGQIAGTLHNLVLDMRSGELKYAVISSGGWLGVHPTLKLAPSRIMSAATTKRSTLAIFTTTGHWNGAPVFRRSTLASLEDPERSREISRYFQSPNANVMNASNRFLSKTGIDDTQTNAPRPELKFVNDIVGLRVVNEKQEKIGEVLDMLVAFGPPHPAFAIIGSGRFFHHGQEYAVPLSAFKPTGRGNKLLLETADTDWSQAPFLSERTWNSPGSDTSNRVYRYSRAGD